MEKELTKETTPLKDCCKKLEGIRVIRNTVDEYVKDGKSYKADKMISESITILCGECYLKVPAGKRLNAILKGLSECLLGE